MILIPMEILPVGFSLWSWMKCFPRLDDQNAEYALKLFDQFGLQLLIVAPLDAKARVTEPFVDRYLSVVKDAITNRSKLLSMTAQEYQNEVQKVSPNGRTRSQNIRDQSKRRGKKCHWFRLMKL